MSDDSVNATAADIAALRRKLRGRKGRRFWKALDEAADTAAFRRWLQSEMPGANALFDTPVDRRGVLKAMAASTLLAGLPGCDVYPAEEAIPWVEQPEQMVPGRPRHYATMVPFMGFARPVVAECHEGRPTRLDGNPRHPAATMALDPFAQAEVLRLYDPDRSHGSLQDGTAVETAAALARLVALFGESEDGDGIRLLTGHTTSPTLARQVEALKARLPGLRRHAFEPADDRRHARAAEAAFGQGRTARPRLDQADLVVSLEDDLLGPGPMQLVNADSWARRRRRGQETGTMNRLFVAESTPTLTGAKAAQRLRTASGRIPHLMAGLARGVGLAVAEPRLSAAEADWVAGIVARLQATDRALVTVGSHQPVDVQALAFAVNDRLGSIGRTLAIHQSPLVPADGGLVDLIEDMRAGRVRTLLMIDADPVFAAPGELGFAEALGRVQETVHIGLYQDATAVAADWHVPLAHPLETWSDARSPDGTAVIGQPTVHPLYGGQHLHEILAALAGTVQPSARRAVQETWRRHLAAPFEESWRHALHEGFVPETAAPEVDPGPVQLPNVDTSTTAIGVELAFRPDPHAWDGTYANVGWLQELPAPLTKLTWDNAVVVSPALAERLGIDNGRVVAVETAAGRIEITAWIVPGQAEDTVTITFGQGRHAIGRVAAGAGVDTYPLRSAASPWLVEGARLTPLERQVALADTQMHGTMSGTEVVRTMSPEEAARPPAGQIPPPAHESIYGTPFDYQEPEGESYAWAMSIDLDACIGCNACVTACVAENNIMVVGKEEVSMGREMHWIRVDRYFEGDLDDPRIHFQPVPCMHCENAPCEVGCPVRATVHGPEGLNQMIYNRCIGTRTCSSYCPYKVRRFNWHDYSDPPAPGIEAVYNPDVTVRARGVMEKCTYCVQRISAARREAKKEGRRIRDGEVKTACQTACPTQAIVFGDKRSGSSGVNRALRDPRSYFLLEELNTRPRTAYRARIRDDEESD